MFTSIIIVNPVIVIEEQPVDEITPSGRNAVFSVAVAGELLQYKWQKDGGDINDVPGTYSGTTTDTLTVESVTDHDDDGSYRVVVSNTANPGGVISESATLTVCECNLYSSCTIMI